MVPLLALGPIAISALILAGFGVFIVGNVWTLVVAAQRSVLWMLAVMLLPLAALIFVIVEPKSRLPFVVAMLGAGMLLGGMFAYDPRVFQSETAVEEIFIALEEGQDALRTRSWLGQGTLEERKSRIRAWQAELEAKKSALQPGDTAARAAFDRELPRYLDALQKLTTDMAPPPKP